LEERISDPGARSTGRTRQPGLACAKGVVFISGDAFTLFVPGRRSFQIAATPAGTIRVWNRNTPHRPTAQTRRFTGTGVVEIRTNAAQYPPRKRPGRIDYAERNGLCLAPTDR